MTDENPFNGPEPQWATHPVTGYWGEKDGSLGFLGTSLYCARYALAESRKCESCGAKTPDLGAFLCSECWDKTRLGMTRAAAPAEPPEDPR